MDFHLRSNAPAVAHRLTARAAAAHDAVVTVVTQQGAALQTSVRAHASGRPGPRAQTGDYRRQVQLTVQSAGHTVTAEVYNRAAQAFRLEFGFWGMVDSLGRLFHQPPYPHFRPAADEARATFPAAVARGVNEALREVR